jgi:hypothetical protein
VTSRLYAMQIDGDPDLYAAARPHRVREPDAALQADTIGQLPRSASTVVVGRRDADVKNVKPLAMNGTPTAARIVVSRDELRRRPRSGSRRRASRTATAVFVSTAVELRESIKFGSR